MWETKPHHLLRSRRGKTWGSLLVIYCEILDAESMPVQSIEVPTSRKKIHAIDLTRLRSLRIFGEVRTCKGGISASL